MELVEPLLMVLRLGFLLVFPGRALADGFLRFPVAVLATVLVRLRLAIFGLKIRWERNEIIVRYWLIVNKLLWFRWCPDIRIFGRWSPNIRIGAKPQRRVFGFIFSEVCCFQFARKLGVLQVETHLREGPLNVLYLIVFLGYLLFNLEAKRRLGDADCSHLSATHHCPFSLPQRVGSGLNHTRHHSLQALVVNGGCIIVPSESHVTGQLGILTNLCQ